MTRKEWGKTRSLTDELDELHGLELSALKQRWRVSTAPKRRSTSVRRFCLEPSPTGCRKEFSAALNPPPALTSRNCPCRGNVSPRPHT